MRQRRALRRAGGAGGELDVDRVVELQRRAELGQARALGVAPPSAATSSKASMPGVVSRADLDHDFSFGSRAALQPARRGVASSGASARSMPT